jgi:hypothetical protein
MDPSGKLAEDGEGLRRRFKRAVVGGGRLKGSRYSDLAEAEIRRCAKSYRGDARFGQYCRQWVAIHSSATPALTIDPDHEKGTEMSETHGLQLVSWLRWGLTLIWRFYAWMLRFARGRKAVAVILLLMVAYLASRPAFSVLCSKLVILTVRESLRRCFCVLSLLVDGLLEEAVAQIDSLLRSPQPAAREVPVAQTAQPTETTHWYLLHWLLHGLCLIFGPLRRRTP